jgi:photosystem II stability/assembly factor-like uncharacterized protein
MRRSSIFATAALAVVAAAGCHREPEMIPLMERKIYTTDRFFDVQALSTDKAIVVGYGGKILMTSTGGRTWDQVKSGVDDALYSVYFADETQGWITGQDGLILHTTDGGKSWQPQQSNAVYTDMDGVKRPAYLFSITGIDAQRLWAVGDRSVLTRSTDGGATWVSTQVKTTDLSGGESLAAADPIFYDIGFADAEHGWIVGEFGKIMYTSDGGLTWTEQNRSLLEGTGFFDPLDLPSLFGVYVRDKEHVIASGLEGHVARTVDGGAVWKYDRADVKIPLLDPLFDLVEFSDGSAWAVGAAGELMHRDPGVGTPWRRAQMASDLSTWLRAIDFFDPQHGWMVGGFGLIFRTTDGGATWLPSQG